MRKINKILYWFLPQHIKHQYEFNLFTGRYELQTSLVVFNRDWNKICQGEKLKYCNVLTVYDFDKYITKDCQCEIQYTGFEGRYHFKTFKSKLIGNIKNLTLLCRIK